MKELNNRPLPTTYFQQILAQEASIKHMAVINVYRLMEALSYHQLYDIIFL